MKDDPPEILPCQNTVCVFLRKFSSLYRIFSCQAEAHESFSLEDTVKQIIAVHNSRLSHGATPRHFVALIQTFKLVRSFSLSSPVCAWGVGLLYAEIVYFGCCSAVHMRCSPSLRHEDNVHACMCMCFYVALDVLTSSLLCFPGCSGMFS